MDVSLVIRRRLKDLGLEQRGLAAAAQVTESYVSQLLARKRLRRLPAAQTFTKKWKSSCGFSGGNWPGSPKFSVKKS